jgi:hypothetical protein
MGCAEILKFFDNALKAFSKWLLMGNREDLSASFELRSCRRGIDRHLEAGK